MVERFFFALDYKDVDSAIRAEKAARSVVQERFPDVLPGRFGVKINQDLMTAKYVDPRLMGMAQVFADLKIAHGHDTGERILEKVSFVFPDLRLVTVAATLGPTVLRRYVNDAERYRVGVVAFTAHTKTPPEDVAKVFGTSDLDAVILRLGKVAVEAGCDAIVLEAERLKNPEIASLPIKKLVTGIRIDPADKGTQSRVSTIDQLREVLPSVDYAVISHRYLEDSVALEHCISQLLLRRG